MRLGWFIVLTSPLPVRIIQYGNSFGFQISQPLCCYILGSRTGAKRKLGDNKLKDGVRKLDQELEREKEPLDQKIRGVQ